MLAGISHDRPVVPNPKTETETKKMRKFITAALLSATLATPMLAHASIISGPKSLSSCDIMAWLGVTNVKSCENY